ncbi:MAG: aminotransferase class I/II-fold pyridoxal phosphate-dependent enzyme [Bacteroidales bacterium]|nr:aminotransferase class I/II-fold pyridoxal phosphate-dependent enzyme [Bacteroidales bacterium]
MEERKTIYLCLAHMSEDGMEQKYVKEAFDTNWVVPMGPNVNAFEQSLEDFVNRIQVRSEECLVRSEELGMRSETANSSLNTPHSSLLTPHSPNSSLDRRVVCLSAGTAAVHLALLACGVGQGDEVIVQSFTFCASSHPITYLGATPVFVDSEPETWNMDPDLLEKAIIDRKEKTGKYPKAIVPVALYGMPYQIDRIMAIADKYGIPVVEDAAEGMGSRFDGQVLGTFGRFGVLSFNGNKMITTSGGGALICRNAEEANTIMWYATQARDAYPYYEHTAIGYNYRMSNVCAGIGRGQMTVLDDHIAHHKHVQSLYKELLKEVKGITLHEQPADPRYDSNFWLCAATIDPEVRIKGQENAYKEVIKTAVGGAAGVIKAVDSATTDCQPNDNVEALRVFMLGKKVECRPVWKPMHKQPVYKNAPAYLNGVSESIFKIGFCLPAGPYVTDEDVRYIVDCIKEAIV